MELTNMQKERVFETITPLIESENITYEKVKLNPILRPLAEKNYSYLTNEKNAIRGLKELDATQNKIKEIIDSNPDVYESTAIIAQVERYKLFSSQVIHALLSQRDLERDAIMEMLNICNIEYGLKTEEVETDYRQVEEPKKEPVRKIEVPSITYFDPEGMVVEPKEENPGPKDE